MGRKSKKNNDHHDPSPMTMTASCDETRTDSEGREETSDIFKLAMALNTVRVVVSSQKTSSKACYEYSVRRRFSSLLLIFSLLLIILCCVSTAQAFPPSPTSNSGTFDIIQRQENTMVKPSMKPKRSSPPSSSAASSSLFYKKNSSSKLNLSILPLMDLSNPLWKAVGTYAAADSVGFLISLATGAHVHLDLIGTGAFALASLPNIMSATATFSQKVSSIAVSLWAIKLASFLFFRATRVGHDMRLEETLSTVDGMFGFWFITFLWNVCCSLPYLLGLLNNNNKSSDPLFVTVGSIIFMAGWIIETTADAQKWFFKQQSQHHNGAPGQFCNVGLWSISQHPNFFGNLVVWAGILVMNIPALIMSSSPASSSSSTFSSIFVAAQQLLWSYRRLALALISPLFMWGLFYGQAQGFVTNSTQLAAAKYGNDPAYEKYLQDVPAIIPKLW
jgi:steroid 5-alpha reductase family enzyme